MKGLELRRYRAADHDQVWDLHNLALNAVGAHAGNGPWDDDLHHIEEIYLASGGEFVVAELQSRIIGMGALRRRDADTADVKRMRVHPDLQRKGVGQAILTQLEGRARELRYRRLGVDTTVAQTGARRFYEKNGYVECGRTRYEGFRVILYEKELLPPTPDAAPRRPRRRD